MTPLRTLRRLRRPSSIRSSAIRLALLLLLAVAVGLAGAILPGHGPDAQPPIAEAADNQVSAGAISVSSAGADNEFAAGDTITVTLTMNINVQSYSGAKLVIGMDSGNVDATPSASNVCNTSMIFTYTVTNNDYDHDGITIATDALHGTYRSSNTHQCSGQAHDHSSGSGSIPNTYASPSASHKVRASAVTLVDYDTDGDRLIEISTHQQLNAVRYDSNGDGIPNLAGVSGDTIAAYRTAYRTAFPTSDITGTDAMGCDVGGTAMQCQGYELAAEIDLASYTNWTPIPNELSDTSANSYTGQFNGNGYPIANLTIANTTTAANYVGLFSVTRGAITNVALEDVSISSTAGTSRVGALAGAARAGAISYSYVNGGTLSNTTGAAEIRLGGLVGLLRDASITASYANVAVTGRTSHTANVNARAGGLVGHSQNSHITATYAWGNVAGGRGTDINISSGGLLGRTSHGGSVITSYSTGAVTTANSAYRGGFIGRQAFSGVTSTANYWDTDTSSLTAAVGYGNAANITGQTTINLRTPTDYTGIYANWNRNLDGDATTGDASGNDNPWDFVDADNYPILRFEYGSDAAANAREAAARTLQIPNDYDGDDDGLIDVDSPDKLNAIRWDLNGDGAPAGAGSSGYADAFPKAAPGMGCPAAGCTGYELTADVDFAGTDYVTNGWTPIGTYDSSSPTTTAYNGDFYGRGFTISNLRINSSNVYLVGLFGAVYDATIENVGLLNVDIDADYTSASTGGALVGALAGLALAPSGQTTVIRSTYATGDIDITIASGASSRQAWTGGLVGEQSVRTHIAASWADVNVSVTSSSGGGSYPDLLGGLVGLGRGLTSITASYASGDITADRSAASGKGCRVGGLVAEINPGGNTANITASYATGAPTCSPGSGGTDAEAGLIAAFGSGVTITNSYWDSDTSGITAGSNGAPKTTSELQTPTEYGTTGDFSAWNVNVDRDTATGTPTVGGDDPWEFGANNQYPRLKFGYNAAALALQQARFTLINYDTDGDDLIEVSTLAQLNAIRYDLDGNGVVSASDRTNYTTAFPNPDDGMGCASGAGNCQGYELASNLDFAGSTAYANWTPIGNATTPYTGDFNGRGYTISNLTIDVDDVTEVGLFGQLQDGTVQKVGLVDVDIDVTYTVVATGHVGALAGILDESATGTAVVRYSYATGAVQSDTARNADVSMRVGGLLGQAIGGSTVTASWSSAAVTTASTAAGSNDSNNVGGLIGEISGPSSSRSTEVLAVYATGAVTTDRAADVSGGIIGGIGANSSLTAAYFAGSFTHDSGATPGGVAGSITGSTADSYWDTSPSATGIADDADATSPEGRTTTQLQSANSYTTGLYANWDDQNVDGESGNDTPWNFGTSSHYPILTLGYDIAGISQQLGAAPVNDYDANDNNLIEISTLAQLAAFRLDAKDGGTDGDGVVTAADLVSYLSAFPGAVNNMGCADTCAGYELMAHLDFDTDGDGSTHTAGVGDADDDYYNGGAGWASPNQWNATFDGNGYTISNLYINRSLTGTDWTGLFSGLGAGGVVRSVGLLNPYVYAASTGGELFVGALVGNNDGGGQVIASYVIGGAVSASRPHNTDLGGLVGRNNNNSRITACYALGNTVTNSQQNAKVGGLLGGNYNRANISASWAASAVTNTGGGASSATGGLVAYNETGAMAATVTDGVSDNFNGHNAVGDALGTGTAASHDTADLQGATGYTAGEPFANFNTNLDGQAGGDDPWDFGTSSQYPSLKYGGHGARSAVWQRGGFSITQNSAAVTALTVTEADANGAAYGIALAAPPAAAVTVAITSPATDTVTFDAGAGTFGDSATLTFTTSNWNTPQTLTIKAAADANTGDETTTLNLAAVNANGNDPSGYNGRRRAVPVTAADSDVVSIDLSLSTLAVTESPDNSTDATYTVVLSNEPDADVTVTVSSDNAAVTLEGPDVDTMFSASETINFDADTTGQSDSWNTPQTITVRPTNDGNDDDERVTLTHTGAGAGSGYENVTATLIVDVTDDDIPNIRVTPPTLSITERQTGTYTVALTVVPEPSTATVAVTLSADGVTLSTDGGTTYAASQTLNFDATTGDPGSWNTARTITVQTADDNDLADAQVTINHRSSSSTDPRYHNLIAPVVVTVANAEQGVINLSATALEVIESGAAVTYTVALGKRPAADATIAIATANPDVTVTPSTLNFPRAGWSATRTQTVTVSAASDTDRADDTGQPLVHTGGDAVTGQASGYGTAGSLVTNELTLTVRDTTAPEITLTPTARAIGEGAPTDYTVVLASIPADTVTVAVASNDTGRATVNPSTLTFNRSGAGIWSTAQTISVTTTADGDEHNDVVVITHTPTIRSIASPATTLPLRLAESDDDTKQTRVAAPPAGSTTTVAVPVPGGSTYDVTVTSGDGVPAGATIGTVESLTADLTITLSAPPDGVPARGGGFRLNAGSIVDITVTPATPPAGLEICLPKGADDIMMLRYTNNVWVEVPGSRVSGSQICATIADFSVFGVGRRAGAELLGPTTEFGEGRYAEITVQVQDTTSESVRVTWEVGEATGRASASPADFANADHTARLTRYPSGSITVPAGADATAVIRIPIYDDETAEGPERFTVRITQATGGVADHNDAPITAIIALSDPSLTLRAPDGTGTGGAGDNADAPLTASSTLVITEGKTNAYTIALAAPPAAAVKVVIHSNHDGVTTNPPSVEFTPSNWDEPRRVTVTTAKDGDGKNAEATLTHILTDADGVVIEIIDQLRLFVVDTDPPDDDDIC